MSTDHQFTATDEMPVLDRTQIDSIRSIPQWGASCFQTAGTVFLKQAPLLLAQIDHSMATNNTEGLHRAIHTLKGSSASVGLGRLARAADHVLVALKAQQGDRFMHLVRILHDESARGSTALQAELAIIDAPGF